MYRVSQEIFTVLLLSNVHWYKSVKNLLAHPVYTKKVNKSPPYCAKNSNSTLEHEPFKVALGIFLHAIRENSQLDFQNQFLDPLLVVGKKILFLLNNNLVEISNFLER